MPTRLEGERPGPNRNSMASKRRHTCTLETARHLPVISAHVCSVLLSILQHLLHRRLVQWTVHTFKKT